ncbi:nucleotide exchange factor GrpE [Candidatus Parcubacteria bacterium]|nr:MAG: nucleotide exchange factor GrpE [Candidatus Parcubacteria bacterium]
MDMKSAKVIVGAFIKNDKDELLLLKSEKGNNKYTCPSGHVEFNEKLEDALKREVKKETGLKIHDIEFLGIGEAVKKGKEFKKNEEHHVYINYSARVKNDKVKHSDESSGYKWLKIEEWKKRDDIGVDVVDILDKLSADTYENMYKRALADYQNLLKQNAKEKQDLVKYANEQFLYELLPVYDNLKVSLLHINESSDVNAWAEGIKYVVKQFSQVLEGIGVEEIKTIGEKFNHETMEAMKGRGEIVKKEVRPGYKLNGKVIIAAKVEL